ncbi:peptidoglycan-binding protein [Streptomyces sp. NPDC059083]|uniref:peptidoglycan-binding protein n=1 Tax=unclassified Streptomyces TaxID=2593676 RepID=UPI0036B83627
MLLGMGGVGGAMLVKSPQQLAAEAAKPPPSVLTAKVEHRILTSNVVTRGKVTAGQTVSVVPQVAGGEGGGAPVVTKLPVRAGQSLSSGQLILEVSGRPVFVLPGSLPGYRDLKPGARGDDVTQLQSALRSLGHSTEDDDEGVFSEGTQQALAEFYASRGYDPLPASDDSGNSLKAAQKALTGAQRALQDAKDARKGLPDDATDLQRFDAQKAVTRAREDLADAETELLTAERATGPRLPAAEVVYLEGFPARVDNVQARPGAEVDGSALTVSAGELVIEAQLQEFQRGMVRKGQPVEINAELSGITARGEVLSVADRLSTVQAGSGLDGSGAGNGGGGAQQAPAAGPPGYRLVVRPDKPLDVTLAAQEVLLRIEAASTDGKALVVPVTALTSGADGRTTVTVLEKSADKRRVEVKPGTAGDGFVAVTPLAGGRLETGDEVITGVRGGGAAQ